MNQVLLLAVLFLIPFTGNRPGSPQAFAIFIILLSVASISLPKILWTVFRGERAFLSNPILLALLLVIITTVASLFPIPAVELYHFVSSQLPSVAANDALLNLAQRFVNPTEDSLLYVLFSACTLILASVFSIAIYQECRRSPGFASKCCWVILAGLIISLVAGLLDYYRMVDLRGLRGLDPVVNPNDIQFRLQSFFGHSGWFAEYVTLAIPFSMIILASSISYTARISLIIVLLVVGELVLILTFQRGGWVSYPLTLIFVWAAIYVVRLIEKGEQSYLRALRLSFIKVILSVPLTVFVSLGVISFLSAAGALDFDPRAGLSKYAERFTDIVKSSDRTEFIKAGYLIGKLHPVYGAGSESFAYQYRKEFLHPEGEYFGEIILPLHGSAHNVYLQTAAGKGLVGFAALLALLFCTIYYCLRAALMGGDLSFRHRLVLLTCASSALAFLIYGNFQEIFYIQSLQYLFFAVIGVAASGIDGRFTVSTRTSAALLLAFAALLPIHILLEFRGHLPRGVEEKSFGCFDYEIDPTGAQYRWCGVRARQKFTVDPQTSTVQFQVEPAASEVKKALFVATVHGVPVLEKTIPTGQKAELFFVLPPELHKYVHEDTGERVISLTLSLGTYMIPAYHLPISEDRRLLSFKLYKPKGNIQQVEPGNDRKS
ncbi:MAG: O-antigen ligase family protein [Deltaproteobacteria bacterium]|nr:O-antigen ligase family protein [Deltaproteobacteria bacterium]